MGHAFFLLAAAKDPKNGEYPFRAGLIAFKKKDYSGAYSLLTKADRISPGRKDVLQNLAALSLNMGEIEQARRYALEAQARGADVSAILSALK